MDDKRERARDLVEQGLDEGIAGDADKGRRMIDKAKKIDPQAVEDLADEVERDREQAEQFIDRK